MIQSRGNFGAAVLGVLFFVVFIFLQSSLCGQIFVDEGLQRGVDAVITSQGFSAPGVSSIDFDQDGDDDLTIGSEGNVFFYQNIGGQFQQIDLNIQYPPGEAAGVIWTDINNDGNLDILLSSYNGKIRLYKNTGGLLFEDITESCGISSEITTNYGVSFSDINRDGYVDLQLCRYETEPPFTENPSVLPELWTRLYLNNGDETFTDLTIESGFVIFPTPVFLGVFLDINNDLWPDNYTIVDRAPGNRMFLNNEGTFAEITEEYGVSYPENDIMSNTVADFDNDGYLDIFMTNDEFTYLLKNNQGESFTNVAPDVGVSIDMFAWGAVWIDADNDGWQDLYYGTPAYEANYFFINDQGIFTQDETAIEMVEEVPSYGAAKGDFDNDGFYDLIIQSRIPDRSPLLMNQGNDNHFIKLTPHGTVSNSMATGSWVKVYADGNEYVHFTLCGEGFISQNSQHLIFGLGVETAVVDSLTIWYPSGHKDAFFNLPADSTYHFYEGETYQVNIITDETSVCSGEEVVLDAGVHANYLWNTGETTRFISADTAGVYSVTVTNEFGIPASNDLTVEILPIPIITETVLPNACLGDSTASISLENILGTPADSVVWDNGMTGASIDSLFSGDYIYVFTDANGCVASGSVSISDPSELLVFGNSTPEDPDQANGAIDLTIFGGVPPYTIIFEGDTVDATISDLEAGDYAVLVIDSYGCAVTVEVSVESTLGIDRNRLANTISVYPNPTHGQVEVKSDSDISRVTVYCSIGILKREEYGYDGNSINLENLVSGLYLLQIELVNSDVGYFRIVKE